MDYSKRLWRDQQEGAMIKEKARRIVGKKAISYMSLAVLSILAACLLSSGYASAAVSKPSEKSSDIEIKIDSTRPRLTAGAGFGITAEITNKSNSIIYLIESQVTMSVSPEVAPDANNPGGTWDGYFPTIYRPPSGTPFIPIIAIAPEESYKVFWFIEPSSPKKATVFSKLINTIRNEMGFIFFAPGDYTITIAVQYYDQQNKPALNKPQDGNYHTKIASKGLTVDAPQSVILFGAMLGGLISYFLFPQARRRFVTSETGKEAPSKSKIFGKEVFGIIGAVLLSAIVTILLSRISETQFLIKVTVADFWGAVAIGFVANYAGAEIINKIIKRYKDEQTSKTASSEQKKENVNRDDS